MHFFGIDVHSSFFQVNRLNQQTGETHRIRYSNTADQKAMLIEELKLCAPCVVAMEACSGAHQLRAELAPYAEKILVVDPKAFRQRFPRGGKKTDSIDADNLALYASYDGQGIWLPDEQTRENRALSRHRVGFNGMVNQLKNQIHAMLKEYHLRQPRETKSGASLWTKTGRKWLTEATKQLPKKVQLCIETALTALDEMEKSLETMDQQMAAACLEEPEQQLIASHPGIGHAGAFIIHAQIGTWKRFSSGKQLTAYAGIVPSVHQSAATCHLGSITKSGRRILRWIIVECAMHARRLCPDLAALYKRVLRRTKIKGKAQVAVARKMLHTVWHMLASGKPYNKLDEEKHNAKLHRMNQKAKKLHERKAA